MNKLASARAKISNALFSNFGEQGLLVKDELKEYDIYIIKQDKSFNVKGQMLRTAPSIIIKSNIKPEINDQIKLNSKTYRIKSSARLIQECIYEVSID